MALPGRHDGSGAAGAFGVRDEPLRAATSSASIRPGNPRVATGAPAAAAGSDRGGGTTWWTLVAIAAIAAIGLAAVVGDPVVATATACGISSGARPRGRDARVVRDGADAAPVPAGARRRHIDARGRDRLPGHLRAVRPALRSACSLAAVYDVSRRLSSQWAGAAAVADPGAPARACSRSPPPPATTSRSPRSSSPPSRWSWIGRAAGSRRSSASPSPGSIRPEAWFLAAAYWLWLARPLSWPARAATAALVVVAPAIWMTDGRARDGRSALLAAPHRQRPARCSTASTRHGRTSRRRDATSSGTWASSRCYSSPRPRRC